MDVSPSRSMKSIDRPRWVLGRTWGADRDDPRVESRFDGGEPARGGCRRPASAMIDVLPTP